MCVCVCACVCVHVCVCMCVCVCVRVHWMCEKWMFNFTDMVLEDAEVSMDIIAIGPIC